MAAATAATAMDYPGEAEFSGFALLAIVCCLLFGCVTSLPAMWNTLFPPGGMVTYLKAGEYGETEVKSNWSVFKEPLNSWTSLFYAVFGLMMLAIGFRDWTDLPIHADEGEEEEETANRLTANPVFSMLYGAFSIYLGVASFLFHASHSEVWRKADAGMTSGTVLPMVLFQLWDRVRAPGCTATEMACIALVLLVSFTYGYLPYGSSDILLPSLVALMWVLELVPRFGGAMHSDQYYLWLQSCLSVLAGVLLRAVDIKRKSPSTARNLLVACVAWVCLCAAFLGPVNFVVLTCFAACGVVLRSPDKGHIFWHLFSSFAIFQWWFLLKYRPGDPPLFAHKDAILFAFALFLGVKNACRRVFMSLPFVSQQHRECVFTVSEHLIMAWWAAHLLVLGQESTDSWLHDRSSMLVQPSLPFERFHLYFIVKSCCLLEDVLYNALSNHNKRGLEKERALMSSGSSSSSTLPSVTSSSDSAKNCGTSNNNGNSSINSSSEEKSQPLDVYKLLWASLALFAYAFGFARVASVALAMHDFGGLPAVVLRLMGLHCESSSSSSSGSGAKKWAVTAVHVCAVAAWAYCRLWVVLHTTWTVFTAGAAKLAAASEYCNNAYCQGGGQVVLELLLLGLLCSILAFDAHAFGRMLSHAGAALLPTGTM
jgi:hypothetical protein